MPLDFLQALGDQKRVNEVLRFLAYLPTNEEHNMTVTAEDPPEDEDGIAEYIIRRIFSLQQYTDAPFPIDVDDAMAPNYAFHL